LEASAADRLADGLMRSGFGLWHDALAQRDVNNRLILLGGLERFREHLGGKLCVTMPDGIGRAKEVFSIDEDRMAFCLDEWHDRAAAIARLVP
jgi:3-dehydroquinate synthase